MFSQFSQLHFLHTCSALRFLASEATDPEHRDASVLVLCFLMHFVEILTEVGKFGEIQI